MNNQKYFVFWFLFESIFNIIIIHVNKHPSILIDWLLFFRDK